MKKVYPLTKGEFNNLVNKYFTSKNIVLADDLTVVIRAHLLIETLIEIMLRENLMNKKILNNNDFTFDMKLTLADSMGIISVRPLSAIRQLNGIRNKFAHNIRTRLQDLDISKITKPLNDENDFKQFKHNKKLMFGLGVHYLLGYLVNSAFSGGAENKP